MIGVSSGPMVHSGALGVGQRSLAVSGDSTRRGPRRRVIIGVSQGSSLGTLKFMSNDYHIKHDLHEMPPLFTSGYDTTFHLPAAYQTAVTQAFVVSG